MNRRHRERIRVRVPFDVCFCYESRRLGRCWTSTVSQEGLFLNTGAIDCVNGSILDLRFRTDGVERRLRGIVVHQEGSQGVGIQLAYWLQGSRTAHATYLQYVMPEWERRAASAIIRGKTTGSRVVLYVRGAR